MTVFDELAETDDDDLFREWVSSAIDAKQEIVSFVASKRAGNAKAEFDSYLKGSFNLCFVIKFSDGGPKSLIRFPKPGHTAVDIREEKVRNEVHVLQFLQEKTAMPVPRVTSWGTIDESPQRLGPFMIMDPVEGTLLSRVLQKLTENISDEVVLADDIDDAKLDFVYEQLAGYHLQLSSLNFDAIGAISKDPKKGQWNVRDRPLLYNVNELVTVVSAYHRSNIPTAPFHSTKEFVDCLANEHMIHFETQRNLANTHYDARRRFIARTRFKQLVSQYTSPDDDTGPFKLYCDDLQPTNMLVDPATMRITAVLDWEFTNSMPAQFTYDPPWWLLLLGPDMWLERYSIEEFEKRYVPRMEQFLRAMERVEERMPDGNDGKRLSVRMRESWEFRQFWYDYGIRKSFDVDAVFWSALKRDGDEDLDEEMEKKAHRMVEMKMEQLTEYDEDRRIRFNP
ncbi:hypothetical protein M011DRAFT_119305 [Sporormia fimetaria CBS 119925]|uniref:Aminoglycoside phosphotransferase domain-containing protein n=1 Tax=Sporormia fimetaria CBS 119925 TaxID=1340428 RepID=A0A6A6VLV5_9PLEO|nr:hypothetical protein M011DRAFT_119305 [Sporormia fimetaria CBS 119925]